MFTPQLAYTGPEVQISYGFTTVGGGTSSSPYASANLGFHVGDDPECVARNRFLLEDELGVPTVWMDQVHSATIVQLPAVEPPYAHRDPHGFWNVGKADGIFMLTQAVPASGIALAVMVADCVPVIVFDKQGRAVAVVHMGRAGMEQEILVRALELFMAQGIAAADIHVTFGPHICGSCYEVSSEVAAQVASVARSCTSWGTPSVDLTAGGCAQAASLGVAVDAVAQCTYEDADYFSYRRATPNGGRTGRFVGVILARSSDTPGEILGISS